MNRLLRRLGVRPWDVGGDDVALPASAPLDLEIGATLPVSAADTSSLAAGSGAALTDSAAHRPRLAAGAGAVSPSASALSDVDGGAALTDSAAHRPRLAAGAGAVSPSASALPDVDRAAALTDTGAQVPRLATGSATPVPTCPDEQRRTNPAVAEDLDAPQQAPCPRTGPDRRWAAIGRGTPDLAAFDGYGRATSAEAGR
ncbi:hypothetical protein APR08_000752 [Nocardia amikacinitolerans]|nr:hypothetical protein [Nocardia amikacinitolerans]